MPKLSKDPKTGVYHVRFQGKHGVVSRSTGETDFKAATRLVKEAKIAELEMAARAGALTADAIQSIMAGRKVTCLDAVEGWAKWRRDDSTPNTVYTQRAVLNQFLNKFKAHSWPITRITGEQIKAFVNADGTKLSNREMRLAALRSFFKFCSAHGYVVGNPAMLAKVRLRDMTMDQKERKERVPFTEREYRHIVAHTSGFWKYATALSYWTGLRLNDICCLEWASITSDEIIVWTRKDEDRVALPLSHPLIGDGDLSLILLEMALQKGERKGDDVYCFPEQRECILDPKQRSKFSVYYGRILERLGIEGKSFHCLRHSFATRLTKAGVTIEQIGRFLGHSSTEVTKGYTHK